MKPIILFEGKVTTQQESFLFEGTKQKFHVNTTPPPFRIVLEGVEINVFVLVTDLELRIMVMVNQTVRNLQNKH